MASRRKTELVAQLELARRDLEEKGARCALALHPGRQIKRSFQAHPIRWFVTTLSLSSFLSVLLRRKVVIKSPRKKIGLVRWLLRLAFSYYRPAFNKFVLERLKKELSSRLKNSSLKSMLGTPSQR
jgi:predicted nucleic acid-binding protein